MHLWRLSRRFYYPTSWGFSGWPSCCHFPQHLNHPSTQPLSCSGSTVKTDYVIRPSCFSSHQSFMLRDGGLVLIPLQWASRADLAGNRTMYQTVGMQLHRYSQARIWTDCTWLGQRMERQKSPTCVQDHLVGNTLPSRQPSTWSRWLNFSSQPHDLNNTMLHSSSTTCPRLYLLGTSWRPRDSWTSWFVWNGLKYR